MKNNKKLLIMVNYIILMICFVIGINTSILDENVASQIICVINVAIFMLFIFGGEGIIYYFLTRKEKVRNTILMLTISLLVNICLSIIGGYFTLLISANQIIGVVLGIVVKTIKVKEL